MKIMAKLSLCSYKINVVANPWFAKARHGRATTKFIRRRR
jgi:hypothetical protein